MTLRREFKHIGKTVNAVGYGAMSLSNFYGPIDHKGCLDIVAACYDWALTISTQRICMAAATAKP